jgi:vanillate O-demethylase ferredoxin subunit
MDTREALREDSVADMPGDRLTVRVRCIVYQAQDIHSYELVDPDGGELPPFTPGSHIDLYFRDGRVRQYSLCGDARDRFRYVIGVQREQAGRGGSQAIFEKVHVGRLLSISHPRNHFQVAGDAAGHLLLAGGIGLTPLLAMARHFACTRAPFELHCFVRTRQRLAFGAELEQLARNATVQLHVDDEPATQPGTPADLVARARAGTHLYFCGPPGFMAAVAQACADWPRERVHFEYFKAPDRPTPPAAPTEPEAIGVGFRVRLASNGQEFDIPDDKSIVQVLREHGIHIPTSCESGLCATCKTRYLAGTPVHLDFVLDEQERLEYLLPCCSRAAPEGCLVLDL